MSRQLLDAIKEGVKAVFVNQTRREASADAIVRASAVKREEARDAIHELLTEITTTSKGGSTHGPPDNR